MDSPHSGVHAYQCADLLVTRFDPFTPLSAGVGVHHWHSALSAGTWATQACRGSEVEVARSVALPARTLRGPLQALMTLKESLSARAVEPQAVWVGSSLGPQGLSLVLNRTWLAALLLFARTADRRGRSSHLCDRGFEAGLAEVILLPRGWLARVALKVTRDATAAGALGRLRGVEMGAA